MTVNRRKSRCFSRSSGLSRSKKGFTLIEGIIVIVIMAFAMVSLTSFLFPQIQDSARPHYEVRASALAHSLMTEILARGYDHNSDPDGGMTRCGETGAPSCTSAFNFGPDGNEQDHPQNFNDVDDYIGCWYTNDASKSYCTETEAGNLTDIFGDDIGNTYPSFAVNVVVEKANIDGSDQFKKVTVDVTAGKYGSYTFTSYRGNF